MTKEYEAFFSRALKIWSITGNGSTPEKEALYSHFKAMMLEEMISSPNGVQIGAGFYRMERIEQ